MDDETRDLMEFAERLADASRVLLLEAARRDRTVEIKADASPVTETDRAIEARMRDMIDARFPDHGVLGEELGRRDLDAEFVWVLDPIDGTAPFIAGIPVYGTLIGLARGGRPWLGVIDHPATDERWTGVSGAFAALNGSPVTVRSCAGPGSAFMTNSSPDFLSADEFDRFSALRDQVVYTQYGGSCYAYAVLATGRTDLAVDSGMEPYDMFACAAVIDGAGGVMTDWSGAGLTLDWTGRVLAAGDPRCHERALALLNR